MTESFTYVTKATADPTKPMARVEFGERKPVIMDLEQKLDFTPTEAYDTSPIGLANAFDTKIEPGYVWCYFSNGNMLRLPMKIFDSTVFRLDENKKDKRGKIGTNFR